MNKLTLQFVILVILIFTSCAITKNDKEFLENKNVEVIFSNPENSIRAESLSDIELKEFEIRAVEKLIDFYDYLNLLSDEKYDKTVKEEVKEATLNLFDNPQTGILPFESENSAGMTLGIEEYLNRQFNTTTSKLITIKSPRMKNHFTIDNQDQFHGQVSYILIINHQDEQIHKTAKVILKRIDKNFGNDSIQIWEVFLAEIR